MIESIVDRSTMFFNWARSRGEIASSIDLGAADGQDHSVTDQIDQSAQKLGRLNALAGALFQNAQGRGRVMSDQGLEHPEQTFVGRRSEQGMDDFDGQLGAAGCQQPIQERLRVAERATGAAGHQLECLSLEFDALSSADLSPDSCAMASGMMPAKS